MEFVWIVLIVGAILVYAFVSMYNALQGLAQKVKQSASNVNIALSKKIESINQLQKVVSNYQQGEQLTHLKVSADLSNQGLATAYQQSGALLSSIQGIADRFPELKAGEQYHRLASAIEACETDVQNARLRYNQSVETYNTKCLSLPEVLIAKRVGFGVAPYLEFDISGSMGDVKLDDFHTADGERLQQLLSDGSKGVAHAAKGLVAGTAQVTRRLADKVRDEDGVVHDGAEAESTAGQPQ